MNANYCLKCDLETDREVCPQCGNRTIVRPAQAVIEHRQEARRWSWVMNGHYRVRAERITSGGRETRV